MCRRGSHINSSNYSKNVLGTRNHLLTAILSIDPLSKLKPHTDVIHFLVARF